MKHPTQPLEKDADGVMRFKQNAIVRHLLDVGQKHGCGLNEIACMEFSIEDRRQFAQLIGYSWGGYEELGYVADDVAQPRKCQKAKVRRRSLDVDG
jgi:hypothetical protein